MAPLTWITYLGNRNFLRPSCQIGPLLGYFVPRRALTAEAFFFNLMWRTKALLNDCASLPCLACCD